MRFRSPTDEPKRVALKSGHTAIIGPEWRELPELFHYQAMQEGCLRDDNLVVPVQAEVKAGEGASNQTVDYNTAYRQALITMITREEPADFTAASLPNINVVSKLCGFSAKKEDVLEVFRQLKEESAND